MEKLRPKCAYPTGAAGPRARRLAFAGLTSLALAWALSAPAYAQGRGDYMNVESPTGHPIEVFEINGHQYLAVANTRDSSIEFFDTDETLTDRRLARVRVGLEPITVRFSAKHNAIFTANFLGDSVSKIGVSATAGPSSFSASLELTRAVADEPIDIAFHDEDDTGAERQTIFVTHMALDGLSWLDAATLDPVSPGFELVGAIAPSTLGGQNFEVAVKEPRTVLVEGDQLVVLALKGGDNANGSLNADLDYYCDDLTAPFVSPTFVGNVGNSGFDMEFDNDGDLYIVGAEALNEQLANESVVAAAPTGFVKSMFYRIENACSNPSIERRDVNLEPIVTLPLPIQGLGQQTEQDPLPVPVPVAKADALSMLLDLAIFETGGTPKVFFTGFGNDRIGVIEPADGVTDPILWPLRRIDIPTIAGNPLAGPAGLALKEANPGQVNDPGARLYSLNHLDASITTIDPVTETIVAGTDLTLANDPRPGYLTTGQQFLYDAKLSATGTVSCASCHVFARTDRLDWDLGTPELGDITIPPLLPDAIPDTVFPADKERLITQSLQGLLNFESPRSDQFWVTNAPYHWRGDRASFLDFNGAFESLLLGDQLSEDQMEDFEEFINTIHYPPNPKQARNRRPTGEFGVGEDIDTDGSTGSMRGLKIFHAVPSVGGVRSCATGCHMGFEGSNNLLTEGAGEDEVGNPVFQPIESAALRGLFQKEARRDIDGTSDPFQSPFSGVFEALTHTGFIPGAGTNRVGSINHFNNTFFEGPLCDANGNGTIDPNEDYCNDLQMVNQYVHQFDWGVAPIVGCVQTVDIANVANAYLGSPSSGCDAACDDLASSLDCMESQADEANASIAVHANFNGTESGFYYNPIDGSYVEEPSGTVYSSRDRLLDQIEARSQLVFQAVPLGDERRIASPSGVATDPGGAAPSNIELLPMVPVSMHERIPDLTLRWADFNNTALESRSVHFTRLFQWGLIQDAASENGFGLGAALRHDAPRGFQVSGDDIRPGAALVLAYPNDTIPPDPSGPFGVTGFGTLTIPIYPTDRVDSRGKPVWESAIRLDKEFYYGLMLGGPFAPNVATAWLDQKPFTFPMQDISLDQPFTGAFDPLTWNWYKAFVFNPDLSSGESPWARLSIE